MSPDKSQLTKISPELRHDWNITEVLDLFDQPLGDLVYHAQRLHRNYHDPSLIQVSTLLNIKSGGCSEDCGYCAQSAHHDTGITPTRLMSLEGVLAAARLAREQGATRFCMGSAGRSPRPGEFAAILEMVRAVKALGLETCVTLGMLDATQARQLKEAGLDYYNHNLDTSPEFYGQVVTTRTYQDRLETLALVRDHQIRLCCGGIIGLGETRADRATLLIQLANITPHPESVPINLLVRVAGTPLRDAPELDHFELIRTVAVTRLLMPDSVVRLSAGRDQLTDAEQALCFFAGANSIFYGARLLTTDNISPECDQKLFARLGVRILHQEQNLEPHGCFGERI